MTLAPPQDTTTSSPPADRVGDTITGQPIRRPPSRAEVCVVTGILVLHDGARWLPECLDALAAQTHPLDRLVVVDTGSSDGGLALVQGHERLHARVGDVRTVLAGRHTRFGAAVALAVEQLPSATRGDWLWLLHDDGAPTPLVLAQLLDAARRSDSVGIAGPKLVDWGDPSRLVEVGLQVTRTGRRAGGPAPGEPDQGQHDHRSDMLGVGTSGMLVRALVYAELRGFEPAFAPARDDLDLCWRAQRAGHRVVVVPQAKMREGRATLRGERAGGPDPRAAARADRRLGRMVALTRCSLVASPFLALWIVLSSIGSAVALLLVKRPGRAWAELGDLGAFRTPWRLVAARWRARGRARVRRRDLHGLFVPRRAAWRHTLDTLHDALAGENRSVDLARSELAAIETGPVADEAEPLTVVPSSLPGRVVRHPGFLAVLAAAVLAVVAWRDLLRAGAFAGDARGLRGGELLPVAADSAQLWHAALDGWHGAGLGAASPASPHLPLVAGASYVVERLPFVDPSASPAGVALAWLFLLAIPLSAWSAYLAARVATHARWPRGWAALAWASLATLTTAMAQGRLGAVVAHILLPLVVAGFFAVARRSVGLAGTFGTALALAVTGAFHPPFLALGVIAAVLLLLAGRGTVRLRALVLLVVPVALLGPYVLAVVADPRLLLSGPGLGVWSQGRPLPWEIALLHPGGPGSYPVLVAAPLVLAGLVGLLRRGPVSAAMTALGALAVGGLALALAASHIVLARVPLAQEALPATADGGIGAAGQPITAWAGTGLDLLALALLAAAILGFHGLRQRLAGHGFGWRQLLAAPIVLAAAVGVLASAGLAGYYALGSTVTGAGRLVPAVAADQAAGPLANRLLVLEPDASAVGYRLVGAEPGPLTRPLPGVDPGAVAARDAQLDAAVRAVTTDSLLATAGLASDRLSDLGVGFVGYRGGHADALARTLDSTARLVRLSESNGMVLWRVLPRAIPSSASTVRTPAGKPAAGTPAAGKPAAGTPAAGTPAAGTPAAGTPDAGTPLSVAPARARLEDVRGVPLQTVDVSGPHARVGTMIAASQAPRRLVVAEPVAWGSLARVTYAGRPLHALPDTAQPTYELPEQGGRLTVEVRPAEPLWRWAQLALLGLVLFLAVPVGRSSRRSRREPRTLVRPATEAATEPSRQLAQVSS